MDAMDPADRKTRWSIGYWVLAVLALLALQSWWQARGELQAVPYSEFERALAEGRVAEVVIGESTVTGRLRQPDARGTTAITAVRVEPSLAERLARFDVPYTRVEESTLLREVAGWVGLAEARAMGSPGAGVRGRAGWREISTSGRMSSSV